MDKYPRREFIKQCGTGLGLVAASGLFMGSIPAFAADKLHTNSAIRRCEDSIRDHGRSTVIHWICLEEFMATTVENAADPLRNRHGYRRICGPGGLLARI